jgi:phosphatidylglycerophosphate synthase
MPFLLGAILDPLADKLLLVSGVILLSQHHPAHLEKIPLWLTATIIGRDVIIVLGLAVVYYTCGKVKIRPVFIGKMSTVLQMIVVLWILLKWDKYWLGIWVPGAGICTIVSGLMYLVEGMRQLSASPISAASPDQK